MMMIDDVFGLRRQVVGSGGWLAGSDRVYMGFVFLTSSSSS